MQLSTFATGLSLPKRRTLRNAFGEECGEYCRRVRRTVSLELRLRQAGIPILPADRDFSLGPKSRVEAV